VLAERVVRFDFGASEDRELPLILALMPVLAKHATIRHVLKKPQ